MKLSATYKARSSMGHNIEVKAADVSRDVNGLIVRLLAQPETCGPVLDTWNALVYQEQSVRGEE